MTSGPPKNVAHSVHQRLLNRARDTGRPFNELLQYYAMERFLYRLSRSSHGEKFMLKGALMLTVWDAPATRPTRDIDLLGHTHNAPSAVAAIVEDLCAVEVQPDGLAFDPATVSAETITHGAGYRGVRVRFQGRLGTAVVHMQVDVGFGDVVTGSRGPVEYPVLLGFPPPRLRGYSRESTIAEKLHAMVHFGELNSRMRDFYDIWLLARGFEFDGRQLADAIRKTFQARETEVVASPVALTDRFARDPGRQTMWRSFRRRSRIEEAPAQLPEVIAEVRAFLGPVLSSLAAGGTFEGAWRPSGPWV